MSRADVRNALADLLEAGLSLPGGNVLRALPGKFWGMTPVVVVLSAGSGRELTSFDDVTPTYLLDIKTYVLLGKADDPDWSSADSEAQLDALEDAISAIVEAHGVAPLWRSLGYSGASRVEDVLTIDGFVYRRETTRLRAECE